MLTIQLVNVQLIIKSQIGRTIIGKEVKAMVKVKYVLNVVEGEISEVQAGNGFPFTYTALILTNDSS